MYRPTHVMLSLCHQLTLCLTHSHPYPYHHPSPCSSSLSPHLPQVMLTSPLLPGVHHKLTPSSLLSTTCHTQHAQHFVCQPLLVTIYIVRYLAIFGLICSLFSRFSLCSP